MATAMSCGTGNWAGPLPGDPDNNSILSAVPAFGGIDVSWTYPNINPHAVAHVLLYRGISSNYAASVKQATVTGSTFYDRITGTAGTRYYYWIQIVSVNGTVGNPIGPATAVARQRIEDTIVDLTGKIDAGVLATSLKTEIDKITLNHQELTNEINSRLEGSAAFMSALGEVQAGLVDSMTFIGNEVTSRKEGQNALVTQLNIVAAANQSNLAAIAEERTVRVSADGALATQLNTVATENATNAAAILEERTTRITQDTAISTLITNVASASQSATNTVAAAVVTETNARTAADSSLASQITTVQSTLNSNIASVSTNMQTQINAVTGELDAIYTAKVDVNGMVGGFGIYGTATSVEAGFDVDTFWVGRTNNKKKPFIISGGKVYIDSAFISKLSADQIDTTNLTIKNSNGQVIFGGGTLLGVSSITGLGSLATANTLGVGSITGLGSLATQNSVEYSNVGGVKPPSNADRTADNTAKNVVGQGELATANSVRLGHNVTFPDGSIIHSGDLVSRLSKINSGTISTFMDGAAITNAYIGNAAVDTLKIAGNAVTVPMSTSGGYGGSYGPSSLTDTVLTSGYQYLEGGSQVTCIVAVVCSNAGGATNGRVVARLRLLNGGSVHILDGSISLIAGYTSNLVSSGSCIAPHDGHWCVEVGLGNNWHSGGPWYSNGVNLTSFGSRR